ncbi:MAG: TIGR02099 family protein [Burkholderiales bacterium]|nr:MAG: TIGR02099 family protein [Burkholderiales bacterium]
MSSTVRRLPTLGSLLASAGLVLVIVVCASFLGVRYWLWPQADRFRDAIVEQLASGIGRPVSIGAIETGWDGLRPSLRLVDVQVAGAGDMPALSLPSLTTVISWRSLAVMQPRVASLRISAPELSVVRMADGRISIGGFVFDPNASGDGGRGAGTGPLAVLLAQQRIDIVDARVRWIDELGGHPELLFEDVQFALLNRGRAHQLSLLAQARGLARRVDLRADFIRMPDAAPTDWRRWRGDFYVRTAGLELDGVRRLAEVPPQWRSGRLDAQAWLSLFEGRLREFSGSVAGAALTLADDERSLELDSARLSARAVSAGDGFRLTVSEASVASAAGLRLSSVGEATAELAADGRPLALRATLGPFDLERLADAIGHAPVRFAPAASTWLQRLKPRASIERLALRWRAAEHAEAEPQLALTASFARLRLLAQPPARRGRLGIPGVDVLRGRIELDNFGGRLTLLDSSPRLTFPGLFADETVAFETLTGELRWSRTPRPDGPPALQVDIDSVRFANADLEGELSGRWERSDTGVGSVDLKGRLARAEAGRAHRYLPLVIGAETRAWIRRSIAAGEARDASFVLRGALADFPYRDRSRGEFRVAAPIYDGRLDYAPGWPAIEALRGEMVFERAGMDIRAQSGRVFGVRLGATRATIADFRDPVLNIEGSGLGPAQDMIRFVNESPVAARIDQFTVDTRVGGSARLDLSLSLPLDDLDRSTVHGTVALRDSEVQVDKTLPKFSAVSGVLDFSEDGFSLRGMSGTMLGGPITVGARTLAPGHIRIDASGEIDAEGMRRVVDNPITRQLSGRTAYRASIEAVNRASRLRIESDLVGLASTLPEPFTKRAAEPLALVVESVPQQPARADARPERDTVRARIGEHIQLLLERRRDAASEKLRVHRGVFTVKVEPDLPDSGFAVTLDMPFIDIDAWHALLASARIEDLAPGARADFEERFSLLPNRVSAAAQVVRVGNRELNAVAFGATRDAGRWRANVISEQVNGYFTWSEALPGQPIGTLTARFNRLAIPESRAEEVESLLSSGPQVLPAIDIAAENLVLGEVELGGLELVAENRGEGDLAAWVIERLKIDNPDATLRATGRWAIADAQGSRRTGLKFELELRDSGRLLGRFGLPGVLRGAPGVMSGEIGWSGLPFSIDYPSLDGEIALAIRQGQFLKVEPGIAKLIGVLSLQSLPKRLSFDFRDVFAAGFLFDEIRGNASMADGVAHTANLRMKGVQAQVRIAGSADIAHETQDLQVDVRPELNAGLASLAYAALANPAVGLGSFLAQLVLRKPLRELFSYQIEVKGSWSDPDVVEKRKERLEPAEEPSP